MITSSPTGGNFFNAIKSIDAKIAISGNFVLTAKNSIIRTNTNEFIRFMFLFCVWDDITGVKVCETDKSSWL